jgi:hypothetical protein
MAGARASERRWGSFALAGACLLIAVGCAYALFWKRYAAVATATPLSAVADTTASTEPAERMVGKSGLPLPRFVSLKADRVNVRRGRP